MQSASGLIGAVAVLSVMLLGLAIMVGATKLGFVRKFFFYLFGCLFLVMCGPSLLAGMWSWLAGSLPSAGGLPSAGMAMPPIALKHVLIWYFVFALGASGIFIAALAFEEDRGS